MTLSGTDDLPADKETHNLVTGHPKRDADQPRFSTLERLRQTMNLLPRHGANKYRELDPSGMQPLPKDRQLTIETAVFPEQRTLFHADGTQRAYTVPLSDAKSGRSGSESKKRSPPTSLRGTPSSTPSSTPTSSKRPKKNRRRRGPNAKPTEIFAQNLSDAVLDADDSDEHDAFVYRPSQSLMYAALPSNPWPLNPGILSHAKWSPTPQDYLYQPRSHTPRRPVLRSTVSEIPTIPFWSPLARQYGVPHRESHGWYPSDVDEEQRPLLRRAPHPHRTSWMMCMWFLMIFSVVVSLTWLCLVLLAVPLESLQVTELTNVLGSSKDLFFVLHVRAKNRNWWPLKISHTSLSVFASSRYVPPFRPNDTAPFSVSRETEQQVPAEFLGTVYHLEEPLLFEAGHWLQPVVSSTTSQVQIKEPGAIHGDYSGNERWSMLIRYPYELTIRGVLKYPVDPFHFFNQVHSARVCQVARVNPLTGEVTHVPPSEKTICDDTGLDIEPS